MVTGSYPEAHGLLGQHRLHPRVNATKGLDTGSRENLEAIGAANGQLLTAPSLGEILDRSDGEDAARCQASGTSGAAFLLNHTVGQRRDDPLRSSRDPPSLAAHVLEVARAAAGVSHAERGAERSAPSTPT